MCLLREGWVLEGVETYHTSASLVIKIIWRRRGGEDEEETEGEETEGEEMEGEEEEEEEGEEEEDEGGGGGGG